MTQPQNRNLCPDSNSLSAKTASSKSMTTSSSLNNTIGNGDQEVIFKGKQTLKKGTYLLKGWIYVADGAELTIEPGTVIKGDKETKASLIIEPGARFLLKAQQKLLSYSHLSSLPDNVVLATGAD